MEAINLNFANSGPAPKEWAQIPEIKKQRPSSVGHEVSLQRINGTNTCVWMTGWGGRWSNASHFFIVKDEAQLEALADKQHEIWAHWMKYMFSQGTFNEDGTWTMPAKKVIRWRDQSVTPYDLLTEKEKESDREQVRKFLHLI